MNVTNPELRRRARETLGKDLFGQKWLMALVVCLVVMLILGTASSIIVFALLIIAGPLLFGLCKTFLIAKRTGKEANFDSAFDGFKNFGPILLLGLMQILFIWLWALLFVIPGIIKAYSYSMVYYIAVDHPEYDWRKCLDESEKLMKGNRWKLFCLDLSFIGWYIVGSLCFGVGTFWVYPYHQMAHTEFYTELVESAVAKEAPTPNDYI